MIYGPAGLYTTAVLPSIVKLVTDIAQARVAAGSAVAGSLVDYVNSTAYMNPAMMSPAMVYPGPARFADFPQRRPAAYGVTVAAPARVALVEGDDNYTAYLEVPNADANDVSVKVDGNQINVYRKARADKSDVSEWIGVVPVPEGVDLDSVTAEYSDGVLKIRLNKDHKRIRREIKVQAAKPKSG